MKKIHNDVKHPRTSRKGERGFSLIELLIAMAVVLVLVSALVIAGSRALRASDESAAGTNVQTLASSATAFQQAWQGFPPAAANMGGLEVAATTAATFAKDQEITTTEAAALGTAPGYVNGGYNVLYAPGATTFTDSAGNTVAATFEFTAIPITIGAGTKAYCSDQTGVFFNNLGTGATPATGGGCNTDGYTSH
jgi:prepilin-type N-terminal cleavage/methylation domain-containing protein